MLGDAISVDMDPTRQDFAERLSHWLTAVDTVTLHATLQSIQSAAAPAASVGPAGAAQALEEAFSRVRASLVDAITGLVTRHASDMDAAYASFHKHHQDLQRQMESKIGPLRAQVRQALSRGSLRHRQLAALDGVMEKTLGGREQRLWSAVPVLFEKRFEHLRQAHAQDEPSPWRAAFCQEWQQVLLAELDVRLQPVMGLMEAFSNEVEKSQ